MWHDVRWGGMDFPEEDQQVLVIFQVGRSGFGYKSYGIGWLIDNGDRELKWYVDYVGSQDRREDLYVLFWSELPEMPEGDYEGDK